MLTALLAGALAGLASFGIQHFTVIPLIEQAETYESAAHPAHEHEAAEWEPGDGWERTSYTALATMLSGIGYSAILFGTLALGGVTVTAKRGMLFGLAAFVCFGLAPALGLPPQPPGVPVADLRDRQLWWAATAASTALGLWLIFGGGRNWLRKAAGVVCLVLPHAIGAPRAAFNDVVPTPIVHQFVVASLATSGIFWLLLGGLCGFLQDRHRGEMVRHPLAETL